MNNTNSLDFFEDYLKCAICLYLLKDPTTIQCGHNFCILCLKNLKSVNCPVCRSPFVANSFTINTQLKSYLDKMMEKSKSMNSVSVNNLVSSISMDINPQSQATSDSTASNKSTQLPYRQCKSLPVERENFTGEKINLYEQAKGFFDEINNIRANPKLYEDRLNSLISQIRFDRLGKPFIQLDEFIYHFKEDLESIKSSSDFLKSLYTDGKYSEVHKHITFWSDKLYNVCNSHLKNPDESERTFHGNVASLFQYESIGFKGFFEGFGDSTASALLYLMDNPKERNMVFCKNYDYGASATVRTKNPLRLKTIILFVSLIYPTENAIGCDAVPTISLDHPAFDHIKYKDQIVGGDFDVQGNIINAVFELKNGEVKKERINLS